MNTSKLCFFILANQNIFDGTCPDLVVCKRALFLAGGTSNLKPKHWCAKCSCDVGSNLTHGNVNKIGLKVEKTKHKYQKCKNDKTLF